MGSLFGGAPGWLRGILGPVKPLPVGQRVLLVVVLVPFLLSIPLALVVAIAEWFPTSWLIAVQVRWNDGYYYSKLTFLLTWLAILLVLAIPLELVAGAVQLFRGFVRTNPELSSAVRTRAMTTRFFRLAGGLLAGVVSVALLGIALLWPQLLDPLGFLAIFSVFFGLGGPPIALLFVFDGLCAIEVIEGTVTGHPIDQTARSAPVRKLAIDGRELGVPPDVWSGTPDGAQVLVAVTGYVGSFIALERIR